MSQRFGSARSDSAFFLRFLSRGALLFCLLLLVTACSARSSIEPEQPWDPIEPVNRGIFWFNDKVDVYVLEPVSDVYDYVLPDGVKNTVGNFFSNLKAPVRIVNSFLQLEGEQGATQFARFCINTTAGAGGLFDVASEWGVNEAKEDFGVTLGTYGVPAGPYLVLPFLGPSNIRDAVGKVGDAFLDPFFYTGSVIDHDPTADAVTYGAKGLEVVQTRYELDPAIETSRKSSLDRYLFVQNAYYQIRNGRIKDGHAVEKADGSGVEGSGEEELSFD